MPPHEKLKLIAEALFRPNNDDNEYTQEITTLQSEQYGIYVAGFLYLDDVTKRPDYQFFEQMKGTGPGYTLNYVWDTRNELRPFGAGAIAEKAAAQFIDSLFFVMRQNQSPWPRETGKFGLAEYLAWLPQLEVNGREIASRNELRALRGWHYCPYGEVAFFLYLWRLLIWASICLPPPNSSDFSRTITDSEFAQRINSACREKNIDVIWADSRWTEGLRNFEEYLYSWVYTDSRMLENPDVVIKGLEFFDNCRDSESSIWNRDLTNLLLFNDDETEGAALKPALRFARAVLSESNDLKRIDSVKPRHGFIIDDGLWDRDFTFLGKGQLEADQYLRSAAVSWLQACMAHRSFDSWGDALAELHIRSRFPIIPYFYWNALDRRAKTHAVVPVWRSWTRPVEADLFREEPQSPLAPLLKPRKSKTSVVGVSVVGMKPLESDSHSNGQDPYQVTLDRADDLRRVDWIEEVLLRASLAQVDSHYYGDLERALDLQQHASQQASIRHDQQRSIDVIAALLRDSSLPEADRLLCTRMLIVALQQKLASYAAFDDSLFTRQDWAKQAGYRGAECRTIAELFNWSVTVALLRVMVEGSPTSQALRAVLFDENEAKAWACLREQIDRSLNSGRGPEGPLEIKNSRGKAVLKVSYVGGDLLIPFRASSEGGGPTQARIYAGLGFLFDEIVLNAFKHQFARDSKFVAETGIDVKVTVSLMKRDVPALYEITLAFSPARATREVPPFRRSKAMGLGSLKFVIERLGFEAGALKEFELSAGGAVVRRVLPYFEDISSTSPSRVWVLKNIPVEAFCSPTLQGDSKA